MTEWKRYRKHAITEMIPWTPDVSMDAITVGVEDRADHPRDGDMVARNPANPSDMWLVAKDFFEANYVSADDR